MVRDLAAEREPVAPGSGRGERRLQCRQHDELDTKEGSR
jgi:hypothetical protein